MSRKGIRIFCICNRIVLEESYNTQFNFFFQGPHCCCCVENGLYVQKSERNVPVRRLLQGNNIEGYLTREMLEKERIEGTRDVFCS